MRSFFLPAARATGLRAVSIAEIDALFAIIAGRFIAGEAGGMKLRKLFSCVAGFAALAGFVMQGCGGGSANTVTVTLSQPTATLVVTQVLNLTATVAGATNVNVNWTCTFTTTTTTTAANGTTSTTTSAAAPVTAGPGVLTNIQPTTVPFTAPSKVTPPPPTATTVTSSPSVTIPAT